MRILFGGLIFRILSLVGSIGDVLLDGFSAHVLKISIFLVDVDNC